MHCNRAPLFVLLQAAGSSDAAGHAFEYVAGADVVHVEVLHKSRNTGTADVVIGEAWVSAPPPLLRRLIPLQVLRPPQG